MSTASKRTSKKTKKNSQLSAFSKKTSVRVAVVLVLFGFVGILSTFFSNALTVTEDNPVFFTMGSSGVETSDGKLWESAGYTANGSVATASGTISGTTEQNLYKTHRKGITSLTVPTIPNGRYKVTLYFADTESTAKNQRVFAINAEGKTEQDSLDIWRKSGGVASKAYIYDFSVTVSDGELNLGFTPIQGTPILSAMELLPRKLDGKTKDTIKEPVPAPNPNTPAPTPTPTPAPTQPAVPVIPTPLPNGGRQLNVTTSEQLTSAIDSAQPGDVIALADGRYSGKKAVGKYTGSFAATTPGTAAKPITIKGSRNAVIDGNGPGGRYGLYLVGAHHWRIEGITVTDATKGIVLDGSTNVVMNNILVTKTGQEGVHFRANSSNGTIMNSEVSYTGIKNATYGEGVYIGSANSNWGTYSGGQPDKSDNVQVLNNVIKFTGAESIDIKEGTTGGIINGNTFDGRDMTGSWADSWIDVKGNNYTITNNTGNNSINDGFQIHVAIKGWGSNNFISGNKLNVNGPGYGLTVQAGTTGNVWKCSNIVTGAASGGAILNGSTPLSCTN